MKMLFTLSCSLLFLVYAQTARAEEDRKCITGYHIGKRTIDKTLGANEVRLELKYFDYQMQEIHLPCSITYRGIVKTFPGYAASITVQAGACRYLFSAEQYISVTSDTLILKAREVVEIRVNFDPLNSMIECDKPVIYFYPPVATPVHVELHLDGKPRFTYPVYKNGWDFTAQPDGKLVTAGKEYNYLFWEGEAHIGNDTSLTRSGFLVTTNELTTFFESRLTEMGFTAAEQQDFITYWVPRMSAHENHFIHFVFTEAFNKTVPLEITPRPDHLFRVFMLWKPVADFNHAVVRPQSIEKINRQGFCVVEWGGTEWNTGPDPGQ